MSISKTLKQLMKVLLVLFMSLTMIVPDGMVKAEDENNISTDKVKYKIGEDILISCKNYENAAEPWVGVYWTSHTPGDPGVGSVTWYDVNSRSDTNHKIEVGPGCYTAYLFSTYDYEGLLGKVDFVVTNDYIQTDKEEYDYNDPIMVSIQNYENVSWVGLYEQGTTPSNEAPSIKWYDQSNSAFTTPYDIKSAPKGSNATLCYEGGEYEIIVFANTPGNDYDVADRKTIKIKDSSSIVVDKQDDGYNYHQYQYNEKVLVDAQSANPDASVRLCDQDPDADYGFNKGYYVSYKLSDYDEPVDILALAIENGVKPEADKDYRLYLISPNGNPDNWVKQAKVHLLVTYYNEIDWELSEDKTVATAVFHRMDKDASSSYETEDITKVDPIAPTCTEDGYDVYEAVLEFTEEEKPLTPSGKKKFIYDFKVKTQEKLDHDWGEIIVDVEPTEEEAGLGHKVCKRCGLESEQEPIPAIGHIHKMQLVEAKEATCTEPGNIKYYHCEKCGENYEDEDGTIHIQDVVIPAKGHDWGEWTFDGESAKTHTRVCKNDSTHKETNPCEFGDNYQIIDGKLVYTCAVCKGTISETLITTDKETYKQWEPINVTVNKELAIKVAKEKFNLEEKDYKDAWVGLYKKDVTPDGNRSIRWYYISEEDETHNILIEAEGHGIENPPGQEDFKEEDLDVYLLLDDSYGKRAAKITIHITNEEIKTGDISLELNGVKQTDGKENEVKLGDPILVKGTTEGTVGGSWVALFKGKLSKDSEFDKTKAVGWFHLSDNKKNEHDFYEKAYPSRGGSLTDRGEYTLVLFGDAGVEDVRVVSYIDVTQDIDHVEIVTEPTCTERGEKRVYYVGETGYETQIIEPLGHDWDEWVFDEATKTHSRVCKRDKNHVETGNCEFDEVDEGDVTKYTCKVCGGTYTHQHTVADNDIFRAAGSNRYLTALAAADVFMEKTGKEKLDTVVLACGSNFADALTGSYLAAVKNAPILLIDDNKNASTVEKYIQEKLVEGGKIYILGGEVAVPKKFEDSLKKAGFEVKRLAGNNRYGTNIEILKEAGMDGDTLLISTGSNFADSLSASAAGLPVLLVKDSLTAEQKSFLSNYSNKKIYILGGETAVGQGVAGELGEFGTVKRIKGNNRYETSVKIAKEFFPDADTIVIAVGDNFPDGLCGGALAYQLKAPVILTLAGRETDAKQYVTERRIKKGVVLGGTNAMKDALINGIFGLDPKTPIEVISK